MKKTVIILILLLSFSVNAQEMLLGKFCTIPIGESDVVCYNFIENQNFEFKVAGCLGISTYGKGKYTSNNGNILLDFDNGKGNKNSTISFKELNKISPDSIIVKLKVTDLNGLGIPVKIYPKEMALMDFDFEKNYTDTNGNWILNEKRNKELKAFVISEVGYVDFEFSLDMNKSQEIKIILAPPSPDSISSKVIMKSLTIESLDNLIIDGVKFKRIK